MTESNGAAVVGPPRFVVVPELAGLRLDQWLAAATPLSRRRARALIAAGRVRLDGRPVRVLSRQVERGDVIEIAPGAGEPELQGAAAAEIAAAGAGPRPLEVVYRDRRLLVVVKPSGMLSQPAAGRPAGDLALDERLRLQLAAEPGGPPRLHLIHRLDRGASGLVIFGLDRATTAAISKAFREGQVERAYRAVVEGTPVFERRIVDGPIARVAGGAWRFEVAAGGRPARTEVEIERRGDGWALSRCRLYTGRTHQVRVHLASLGHPVRGDRLYGAPSPAAGRPPRGGSDTGRLLLHGEELAFHHPETGVRLVLRTPLPEAFARYRDETRAPSR